MFSVIFDMDGTLLDTQKICIDAWDYAGSLQSFSNVGAHIPNVWGMNEVGWSNYLVNEFKGLDIDAFKKEAYMYIEKNGKVEFKKGAVELIEFLKENNIKIAIASGSSAEIIKYNLSQVGAVDVFDEIEGGDEVERGKPEPDIFLLAAKKLGVKPETCFVFEDSANGIKSGYAAGMKCIGIPDVAPFSKEAKELMLKELESLSEGIEILREYL